MSITRLCALGFVGTLALAGCGGGSDDGPAAKPGMTNAQGAKVVVGQTVMLQTAAKNKDAASLSATTQSLAISGAKSIVSPSIGQPLVVQALSQALTQVSAQAGSAACPQGGSATCTDGGCTYNMCKQSDLTINGGIKIADASGTTTITNDMTISGKLPGGGTGGQAGNIDHIDWKITGALMISTTSISGTLQSSGTAMISGVPGAPGNFTYTDFNLIRYNAVVLNGTSATAGSIYAKWSVGYSAAPQATQAFEGTVNFP
jgi:hypothetical protein